MCVFGGGGGAGVTGGWLVQPQYEPTMAHQWGPAAPAPSSPCLPGDGCTLPPPPRASQIVDARWMSVYGQCTDVARELARSSMKVRPAAAHCPLHKASSMCTPLPTRLLDVRSGDVPPELGQPQLHISPPPPTPNTGAVARACGRAVWCCAPGRRAAQGLAAQHPVRWQPPQEGLSMLLGGRLASAAPRTC